MLGQNTVVDMTAILAGICLGLYGFSFLLRKKSEGRWLPDPDQKAKHAFEKWCLLYTAVWIFLFGGVVVTQAYEWFEENEYMKFCVGLAVPLLLQPFLYPVEEWKTPLLSRVSFKANVWIAIFSFIGNYWYTHYFYSVLKAKYTFPAHRLNDVPIAMFFATHFYFMTYHTFSNMMLRKIETRYKAGWARTIFFWGVVLAFSYFTAFMESLTISSFPYYSFEDKDMAYKVGSAFYGIYFIVSFPMFYRVDKNASEKYTIYRTIMDAFAAGMIVMCLLDFVRLQLGIELSFTGKFVYLFKP